LAETTNRKLPGTSRPKKKWTEVAILLQTMQTLVFLGMLAGTGQAAAGDQPTALKKPEQWRALHLLVFKTDKDLDVLGSQIPKLAQMGVNVLILEIDYNFRFQSHPIKIKPW
jgi:hypothetical protein